MLKIQSMRVNIQERPSAINKHIKNNFKKGRGKMGKTRSKIILVEQSHLLVHMYGKILDTTFLYPFHSLA